jgi:lysophospholipid acyltransferase (LPLAT)-like uncharacterized protein
VTDQSQATAVPPKRRRSSPSKRLVRSAFGTALAGGVASALLKFVYATNRMSYEPAREAVFAAHAPFILTCWHGQAFMLPVVRPPHIAVDVLASRSADGEIIARVMADLGLGVIRGSGSADPARMFEKGAIDAFRGMKASLDAGRSVALTADFMPKARRKVSPGIILLARLSGRPIVPVAVASSRRVTLNSWDKTTISLPFGRTVCVAEEVVVVPRHADETQVEAARQELEDKLNRVYARAYEIVDGKRG